MAQLSETRQARRSTLPLLVLSLKTVEEGPSGLAMVFDDPDELAKTSFDLGKLGGLIGSRHPSLMNLGASSGRV